jgi:hypothetical protein
MTGQAQRIKDELVAALIDPKFFCRKLGRIRGHDPPGSRPNSDVRAQLFF